MLLLSRALEITGIFTIKAGRYYSVLPDGGIIRSGGNPAQEMKPGDVVNIPPEVKHWHGAAPDSWFSHLAVEVPAEGGSNEWLEPVGEQKYNKLK